MLIKTKGTVLLGIEAIMVTIEVNVSMGQGYHIVGLPDSAVKESLDRTESALKANGYHMPRTKILVNLLPADLKKTGAAFDLPIAIGMLAASEQLHSLVPLEQLLIMGEMGLDGLLYPIKGAVAMAIKAKVEGISALLLPMENLNETKFIEGLPVFGFNHLNEVVHYLKTGHLQATQITIPPIKKIERPTASAVPLFEEIKGQAHAKRALQIASAGGHNMIMIGPPGTGKTMLARSMVSILPPFTQAEAIESTQIYSAINKERLLNGLLTHRPFRQPHHTISNIAMVGGGAHPQPGEISLAHNGVLFLDELPEFNKNVIEVLRQPMEEGVVHIARAKMSVQFPAQFMLLASMNPCPCGYYNHPTKQCACSKKAIKKYLHSISGPILDRIDLHVEVIPVDYKELSSNQFSEKSSSILETIVKARALQIKRYENDKGIYVNRQMSVKMIKEYCSIHDASQQLLNDAMRKLQLSARSYHRILKVSRTIADLADSRDIQKEHVAEAIQYRSLDRENWGG